MCGGGEWGGIEREGGGVMLDSRESGVYKIMDTVAFFLVIVLK